MAVREGEPNSEPIEEGSAGPGLIDHVMITSDALDELGDGVTEVLRLDQTIADYQDVFSDHVPVVTRFEIPAP